jgi:hypothetical protein
MAESDRGVHPDLVEEIAQERDEAAAAPAVEQNTGGRSRRARTSPSRAATSSSTPEGGPDSGESSAPPESGESSAEGEAAADWRASWNQAQTPEEAFALLARNLPSDILEKDERLSGLIGSRSDQRARDLLRQQERDAIERQKREAAANNDLYTLGELQQREYAAQQQANAAGSQYQPMMEVVKRFQDTLPEPLQREVAGKTFGEGKTWGEGLQEYMSYLVDSATKLRLSERESALRKAILSEINGSEPVPEREGGTPSRVRVVTSEQVDAMSLREYEGLFDENGHPRPGVQYRVTRGTPLQRP